MKFTGRIFFNAVLVGLCCLLFAGMGFAEEPANEHDDSTSYEGVTVGTENEEGEIDWDDLPSGTHCGVYMRTQSHTYAYKECQGHNPRNSCPAGFQKAMLGYFEAAGGDRYLGYCVKQ